mgnify:CR=1 FL=1
MCYHKQDRALEKNLTDRYNATIQETYQPLFHENGFNHIASPVITAENKSTFRKDRKSTRLNSSH